MTSSSDEGERIGEIMRGLVSWLDDTDAPASHELIAYRRPVAGHSGETLLVELRRSDAAGIAVERLALKLPPSDAAIFPTHDQVLQARVQEAVAAAGIPAAVPARAELDTRWIGTPFLVMPAIDGDIFDEIPALDVRLQKGDRDHNARVHSAYLDVLADVHRIEWRSSGLLDVVPRRDNEAELTYWRGYLDWCTEGTVEVAELEDALEWCAVNRPDSEPEPSLLWGDVRLGNVIFDAEREPAAVLDWEMATIGSAEHDLAWTLSLQATQDTLLGRTVPGFLDRDAAIRRYEARLGRSMRDLEWYETLAMVRSAAILTRLTYLDQARGQPVLLPIDDNPILDLLTRRTQHPQLG